MTTEMSGSWTDRRRCVGLPTPRRVGVAACGQDRWWWVGARSSLRKEGRSGFPGPGSRIQTILLFPLDTSLSRGPCCPSHHTEHVPELQAWLRHVACATASLRLGRPAHLIPWGWPASAWCSLGNAPRRGCRSTRTSPSGWSTRCPSPWWMAGPWPVMVVSSPRCARAPHRLTCPGGLLLPPRQDREAAAAPFTASASRATRFTNLTRSRARSCRALQAVVLLGTRRLTLISTVGIRSCASAWHPSLSALGAASKRIACVSVAHSHARHAHA